MKYLIYSHSIDGVVVYVGKGCGNRPYSRKNRSRAWWAVVGDRDVDVCILDSSDSNEEALDLEEKYIKKFSNTICNVHRERAKGPVKDVIRMAGGARTVSAALGITTQSVGQWRKIPSRHVVKVARMAKLKPEDVAPEMFA